MAVKVIVKTLKQISGSFLIVLPKSSLLNRNKKRFVNRRVCPAVVPISTPLIYISHFLNENSPRRFEKTPKYINHLSIRTISTNMNEERIKCRLLMSNGGKRKRKIFKEKKKYYDDKKGHQEHQTWLGPDRAAFFRTHVRPRTQTHATDACKCVTMVTNCMA